MSDDGDWALVVIAMVGNPFSPAYARARDRGAPSALPYSSMNVALYGPRGLRGRLQSGFALEEHAVRPGDRTESSVTIGRSTMAWLGDRLVVDLDERTTPAGHPFRRPLRGRVTIHPEAMPGLELPIDEAHHHRWWPVAPLARIEVDLHEPDVRFSGHGYHDANAGDVPLDATFSIWSWSRARLPDGACLTYDVACLSGAERTHAFRVARGGEVSPLDATQTVRLEPSIWRIPRDARVDRGAPARTVRHLEDGPFYTRSLVETRLTGRPVVAMHETLAAYRLPQSWVRFCTAYRMRTSR